MGIRRQVTSLYLLAHHLGRAHFIWLMVIGANQRMCVSYSTYRLWQAYVLAIEEMAAEGYILVVVSSQGPECENIIG